jgi:hypothetical protein
VTLDNLIPLVALLLPAVIAWAVTLRFGFWIGAVIPAGVAVGFWIASAQGTGHPEEVMGRGLELLFVWLPGIVSALTGFGLGLIVRAKRRREAGKPG